MTTLKVRCFSKNKQNRLDIAVYLMLKLCFFIFISASSWDFQKGISRESLNKKMVAIEEVEFGKDNHDQQVFGSF